MAFQVSQMGCRFLIPISFSYYQESVRNRGCFYRDLLHRYARILSFQFLSY